MAWLIRKFNKGMLVNLAFAGGAFFLFYMGNLGYEVALRDVQYFNGWILTVCMIVMMALTLRKRMVILPFGKVRLWLLLHYYLGFLTAGIFLVHSRWRFPDSPLEWLLWALFIIVAVSGLFGGLVSKLVPKRLEVHGERILFERIPVFRNQLAEEAEALALESVKGGNTVSIANLYTDMLGEFFARPRNYFAHLRSSNRPLSRIMGEMVSIERYLDDEGRTRLAKMRDLVETKNNLDFQYANGSLLKLWLFLHIPATYALIIAIVAHIVVVYAFSAGIA